MHCTKTSEAWLYTILKSVFKASWKYSKKRLIIIDVYILRLFGVKLRSLVVEAQLEKYQVFHVFFTHVNIKWKVIGMANMLTMWNKENSKQMKHAYPLTKCYTSMEEAILGQFLNHSLIHQQHLILQMQVKIITLPYWTFAILVLFSLLICINKLNKKSKNIVIELLIPLLFEMDQVFVLPVNKYLLLLLHSGGSAGTTGPSTSPPSAAVLTNSGKIQYYGFNTLIIFIIFKLIRL